MSIFRRIGDTLGEAVGGAKDGLAGSFGAVAREFGAEAPAPAPGIGYTPPQVGGLMAQGYRPPAIGGNIRSVFNARFGNAGGFTAPGFSSPGMGYRPPTLNRPVKPEVTKVPTVPGGPTSDGTGDAGTAKWRTYIEQAASEFGISDPDIIQAIMMIESGGNERAQSSQGAQGLMQVMPFHWKPGEDPWDPQTNVRKGASILADNYKRYGDWDKAVAAYLGAIDGNGNITTSTDANGTDGFKYVQMFRANLAQLKAAGMKPAGGGGGAASIWGGKQASVTQEYGVVTPGIDQGIYGYGTTYGLPQGHTGWDVGLGRGSQLYMPAGLTGVVEVAGGTQFFRDEDYGDAGTPGKGELRIRLSNGDILILGHTSQINVKVGQQVTGGQAVGLSGSASGDHLHLEVRQRQVDGSYRLVNPGTYFGGR